MDHQANQQAKAEALAAGWTEQDWRAEFRGWQNSGAVPAEAAATRRRWAEQFPRAAAIHNAVAKGWEARA